MARTTPSVHRPGARAVVVDVEHGGRRIDNFLCGVLKGVPKERIYRMLRTGEVRVNSGRIGPGYRLAPGEVLRIPPVYLDAVPEPGRLKVMLRQRVLYEDQALLVLDKPAGLAVHAGTGLRHGVIEGLRAEHPGAAFLELVHRLDRTTSGCLLIAKRPRVLRALHQAIRAGAIEKAYVALLRGRWTEGTRVVDVPLGMHRIGAGERVVSIESGGKPSQTRMHPLEVYDDASLVGIVLGSGRMHQIRVHAAHIGHPVAGDGKYGDEGFNRVMRRHGLRRLFLHAERLRLRHPETGRELVVRCGLPEVLAGVLESLRAAGGSVPPE